MEVKISRRTLLIRNETGKKKQGVRPVGSDTLRETQTG